jgi:Ser/Thr protein kinase RdoA (MazF antagonist)
MDRLSDAAEQFTSSGAAAIQPWGSGNINETFLVTPPPQDGPPFILQRLNRRVFRRPELVMLNIRAVTEHVGARLRRSGLASGRRWELPRVLPASDGRDHWLDGDGSFWRAMTFIPGAESHDAIQGMDQAREVGYALGMFHDLISDLPADKLADTLEGFHVAPRYLERFDRVAAARPARPTTESAYCFRAVSRWRGAAGVLEDALANGTLRLRPIHGDPKVNNVLLDAATGRAVSMIDLDTVKPGLIHYDVGDCLRSSCNPLGEETDRWEAVRFEPDLCRGILQGYLPLARSFLTDADHRLLYEAARLLTFELGLRFFTDHLAGDVYFKVRHPQHNLARALVQFRLAESIESQEASIRSMLAELR